MTQENPAGLGSDSRSDPQQVSGGDRDVDERRPTQPSSLFPFGRTRFCVTLRMVSGYVTMVDSGGNSLGSWTAADVAARALGGTRYQLNLGDQQVLFYADGPADLVRDLEAEADYFRNRNKKSVARRPMRLCTGHLPGLPTAATSRHSTPDAPPSTLDTEDMGYVHVAATDFLKKADVGDESLRVESLHAKVAAAQREVIRSIADGMLSWLGYYLLLSGGTELERLTTAGQGLHAAASQLRGIAGDLDYLSESESLRDDGPLDTYQEAVGKWANALEMMGQGALCDHRGSAEEGFQMLSRGTATAEQVVDRKARAGVPDTLPESLTALRSLRPVAKVHKAALKRAKEPWKKAMIAAGSPLRWLD